MMNSTLSVYELQRLENIARNKEVLTSLGLAQAAPIPAPKRSKPKVARPPTAPSRKSGRLMSVPAPSVYVDSERSNGMVMLGGADAAEVAATSAHSELVAATGEPTDEDPAPDAEDQLFPSEAKARALATSLILTQLACSLACKLTSPSPPHLGHPRTSTVTVIVTLTTLNPHPGVCGAPCGEEQHRTRAGDGSIPRGAEPRALVYGKSRARIA